MAPPLFSLFTERNKMNRRGVFRILFLIFFGASIAFGGTAIAKADPITGDQIQYANYNSKFICNYLDRNGVNDISMVALTTAVEANGGFTVRGAAAVIMYAVVNYCDRHTDNIAIWANSGSGTTV